MSDQFDYPDEKPQKRRRHRSRPGPLLPTIWFSLLGLNWIALTILALIFFVRHPLSISDLLAGSCGVALGLFYFWVAYAVFCRRKYILDIAFACAGLGILSIPVGTILSLFLVSSLMARKHDFTK
jgi:hypothetical protein